MTSSVRSLLVLLALLVCVDSIFSTKQCYRDVSAPVAASRVLGQKNFYTYNRPGLSKPVGIVSVPGSGKIITSSADVPVGSHIFTRFVNTASQIQGEEPEGTFIPKQAYDEPCDFYSLKSDANRMHVFEDFLLISDSVGNRIVAVPDISTSDLSLPQEFFPLAGNSDVVCPADNYALVVAPQGLFLTRDGTALWVAARNGIAKFIFSDVVEGYVGGPAATQEQSCTATNTYNPTDVAIDKHGYLWVADSGNNRVLNYGNASNLALDRTDAALEAIGQPDLTTCSVASPPSKRSLYYPTAVTFDSEGTLYISDFRNHRVMIYLNAAGTIKACGREADYQLGQRDFDNKVCPSNYDPYSFTSQVCDYDSVNNELIVADTRGNRVLTYCIRKARCGDGRVDQGEQCDPPSMYNCCTKECRFANLYEVCEKAKCSCHQDRRCVYADPARKTGRKCGPVRWKKSGTRCSNQEPYKRCNCAGKCV